MIGSLSMEDLARIRRMSVTDAESFIQSHTLTDEERKQVLGLAGKSLPAQPAHIPHGTLYDAQRPTWFVTAWLLGASWRQLAYLHKITPQTVMASADKVMPSPLRQAARLRQRMSLEELSAYRAAFIAKQFDGMEPAAIAEQLLSTTDTDT